MNLPIAESGPLPGDMGEIERLNDADEFSPPETWLERLCQLICEVCLVVMFVMIGAEVLRRAVFGTSFEITDEIGGYLLVAISFFSLPVCQVHHAFHHVEFVQARLGPLGRAVSRLIFDLLCFGSIAILLWQLSRLEMTTYFSEDVAPTILATPLWIPRLSMPLGCAILALTFIRTLIGDVRRIAAATRAPLMARSAP